MKNATMRNDMSLVTLTHRVINFHTPFRHGISSHYIYYIVRMFNPVSVQCGQGIKKISLVQIHLWSKGSQSKKYVALPKQK